MPAPRTAPKKLGLNRLTGGSKPPVAEKEGQETVSLTVESGPSQPDTGYTEVTAPTTVQKPLVTDFPPAAEPEIPTEGSRPVLVEFRNVTKKYGSHAAINDISLKLYKGEFLSLVGPSGAGKSTLIKCMTLQERPEIGRVIVAGRDITQLRKRELPFFRRKVGFVFQDYKLLASKTAYENIAFALEVSGVANKEIRQRVDVMLETVGMSGKRNSFPHELSGGEQQRVAIARALVHDPKILIADEPTGNLDPVNTWEIIELLYKINRSGTMVVLATHDREIVDALQRRVITLRDGTVVADQEQGTYLV
jgi:cell division transport system ATP-binding protein